MSNKETPREIYEKMKRYEFNEELLEEESRRREGLKAIRAKEHFERKEHVERRRQIHEKRVKEMFRVYDGKDGALILCSSKVGKSAGIVMGAKKVTLEEYKKIFKLSRWNMPVRSYDNYLLLDVLWQGQGREWINEAETSLLKKGE